MSRGEPLGTRGGRPSPCACPGARGGSRSARLDEQHERTGGVAGPRDRVLRGGDLVERAADVHGGGRATCRGLSPRDRPEGPVELEDARPVAVAREPSRVPAGQARAGQPQQLTRGHVEQRGRGARELVEGLDPASRFDPAAQRAQLGRERVGQSLGAALSDGPADPVRAQREHDSEGRAGRAAQRQHRVAQQPASSARARSPSKRERASPVAERRALGRSAPSAADGGAAAAGRGSRA